MTINEDDNPGIDLHFPVRVDTAWCQTHEPEVWSRVQQCHGLVTFDMEGVTYICSAFLRLCLRCGKQLGSERFRIRRVSAPVKKVFKIAGFDQLLAIQ